MVRITVPLSNAAMHNRLPRWVISRHFLHVHAKSGYPLKLAVKAGGRRAGILAARIEISAHVVDDWTGGLIGSTSLSRRRQGVVGRMPRRWKASGSVVRRSRTRENGRRPLPGCFAGGTRQRGCQGGAVSRRKRRQSVTWLSLSAPIPIPSGQSGG